MVATEGAELAPSVSQEPFNLNAHPHPVRRGDGSLGASQIPRDHAAPPVSVSGSPCPSEGPTQRVPPAPRGLRRGERCYRCGWLRPGCHSPSTTEWCFVWTHRPLTSISKQPWLFLVCTVMGMFHPPPFLRALLLHDFPPPRSSRALVGVRRGGLIPECSRGWPTHRRFQIKSLWTAVRLIWVFFYD